MIRRRRDRVAVNGKSPIIRKDVAGQCNVGAIAAHPARTLGRGARVIPPTIVEKEIAKDLVVGPASGQSEHPVIGYDAIGDDGPGGPCHYALPDTPFDHTLLDHVRRPAHRGDTGPRSAI